MKWDKRAIRDKNTYGHIAPGTEWGEVCTPVVCLDDDGDELDNVAFLSGDDLLIVRKNNNGQWIKGRRYLVHIFLDDGK